MYAQENQDLKIKLDKHVANNAEEWDIKNGVRSLPSIFFLSHVSNSPRLRNWFVVCAERGMLISEQKRLLEESERMIADNNKRLGAAVHELRDLIVRFSLRSLSSTPNDLSILSTLDPIKS